MANPDPRLSVAGVRAVMIFCESPIEVAGWWAGVFGVDSTQSDGFHWLDLPGGVELGFHPADRGKNAHGRSTVVYWSVSSVLDAVASLSAAGAVLHRGPLEIDPQRRIAQMVDPYGNVFGLDGA